MHATHHRLIAYILLVSHSLMSCYNPDIVAGQKQISQHIQGKRQEVTIRDIKEEEQQAPSRFLSITSQTPSQAVPFQESLPGLTEKVSDISLSTQTAAKTRYTGYNKTDKPTVELPKLPAPVLVSQPQRLSANQGAAKMRQGQENVLADETNEAEQLTPVFTMRGGIQVQFVKDQPHALQAKIIDQFGLTYYVPVTYENNIPVSLAELIQKGAYEAWVKSNVHFIKLGEEKCVYIGKQGLNGGLSKDDCPYKARVSEGSSFTECWNSSQTNRVEFESLNGCWRGQVRHGEYWLSSDNDTKWDWGWVYANYSDLSEEELRACSKEISYKCGIFGGINDVNYILAYLAPSTRSSIQRNKEERRKQEAERLERERKQREEEQRRKEEKYAKEHAVVLEQRDELVRECTQLHTKNNQVEDLAGRVIQLQEKNLVTAKKVCEAQTDNLDMAQRLSQDTSDLTQRLQETKQTIQDLQKQKSKDQQRKKEID